MREDDRCCRVDNDDSMDRRRRRRTHNLLKGAENVSWARFGRHVDDKRVANIQSQNVSLIGEAVIIRHCV